MVLLKLLALVWLILIVIGALFFIVGFFIEKKFDESHAVKKWWRRHIVAPDPYDNDWKNFNG